MTLTERLSRAEGSAILKKVLLGMHNAEVTCLQARDRITALEAENAKLREYAVEVTKAFTGLTVQGSEFFKGNKRLGFYEADIPACVKNVEWRMEQRARLAVAKDRAALAKHREGRSDHTTHHRKS